MKLAIKIDDSGLFLLEVLIAFVVLTTTLFAVMNSFALAARRNIDAGRHQTALALAQNKLEELKNETYNNVVEIATPVHFSSESDYSRFSGFTYTILIDDSSFDELNKTVSVVVAYNEGDTTKQVALTTGFTKR